MPQKYPHILLPIKPVSSPFTTTQGGGSGEEKIRHNLDPLKHSRILKSKFDKAWTDTESEYLSYRIERNGIYLEFRGERGYDLTTKSLDDLQSKKIRLLNIREDHKIDQTSKKLSDFKTETRATVFVANEKKGHF
ncbi:MAG: hypothetical protein MI802_05580, partial [Desulfobacterales bacterium]|nr:hypothetical protein [Desulfobacterales bacterium]